MHYKITNKAFTLIEMLAVVAIIGILSGIIAVSMGGVIQSANVAKGQAFSLSIVNSLATNLVSEWKLDKINIPSTNLTPDTWSTNNCTLSGSTLPSLQTAGCVDGNCLSFNGTTAYLDCGRPSSLNILNAITIAGWYKSSGTPSSDYTPLFGKPASWYIHTSTAVNYNYHFFQIYNAAGSQIGTSGYSVKTDEWHYYTGTYNSSTGNLYFYVDGIQRATTTTTGLLRDSSTRNMLISGLDGRYINGSVDNVTVYNSTATLSLIREQYYEGMNKLVANGEIAKDEYKQRLGDFVNNYSALLTK